MGFVSEKIISSPALWGKLPSHADYIGNRVRAGEAQQWQAWYMRQMAQAAGSTGRSGQGDVEGRGDLQDDNQAHLLNLLRSVPISFILPPGTLDLKNRYYLAGIITWSVDRLGREHPLIVYQRVLRIWLEQSLVAESQYAPVKFDWLYWLRCLIGKYMGSEVIKREAWDHENLLTRLLQCIDEMWQLFTPDWRQMLRGELPCPATSECQKIVEKANGRQRKEFAGELRLLLQGSNALPWSDWPTRILRREQPLAVFWQQDESGRFISAAQRLKDLWRPISQDPISDFSEIGNISSVSGGLNHQKEENAIVSPYSRGQRISQLIEILTKSEKERALDEVDKEQDHENFSINRCVSDAGVNGSFPFQGDDIVSGVEQDKLSVDTEFKYGDLVSQYNKLNECCGDDLINIIFKTLDKKTFTNDAIIQKSFSDKIVSDNQDVVKLSKNDRVTLSSAEIKNVFKGGEVDNEEGRANCGQDILDDLHEKYLSFLRDPHSQINCEEFPINPKGKKRNDDELESLAVKAQGYVSLYEIVGDRPMDIQQISGHLDSLSGFDILRINEEPDVIQLFAPKVGGAARLKSSSGGDSLPKPEGQVEHAWIDINQDLGVLGCDGEVTNQALPPTITQRDHHRVGMDSIINVGVQGNTGDSQALSKSNETD